jgi:hypothetical protein
LSDGPEIRSDFRLRSSDRVGQRFRASRKAYIYSHRFRPSPQPHTRRAFNGLAVAPLPHRNREGEAWVRPTGHAACRGLTRVWPHALGGLVWVARGAPAVRSPLLSLSHAPYREGKGPGCARLGTQPAGGRPVCGPTSSHGGVVGCSRPRAHPSSSGLTHQPPRGHSGARARAVARCLGRARARIVACPSALT